MAIGARQSYYVTFRTIPGYFNAFMASSLLFDRQPPFSPSAPTEAITILIACRNEVNRISETLHHIAQQDYASSIKIILIDNGLTDETALLAAASAREAGLHLQLVSEPRAGKHYALNRALPFIVTRLFISLDADTLLHRSAIHYIVSRMLAVPVVVAAIAGTVLSKRNGSLLNHSPWHLLMCPTAFELFSANAADGREG